MPALTQSAHVSASAYASSRTASLTGYVRYAGAETVSGTVTASYDQQNRAWTWQISFVAPRNGTIDEVYMQAVDQSNNVTASFGATGLGLSVQAGVQYALIFTETAVPPSTF